MVFGATFGQPATDSCYVKATFVVITQNAPSSLSGSGDATVEFSRHISSHGTGCRNLYEVNGVVCELVLNFCSTCTDILFSHNSLFLFVILLHSLC